MIGKKANDLLKSDYGHLVVEMIEDSSKNVSYQLAEEIGTKLIADYEAGECEEIILFYIKSKRLIKNILKPSFEFCRKRKRK